MGAGSKIGYYFVVFANNGSLIYKTKIGLHLNDNSTEGMFPPNEIIPGSDGGVDSFSAYNPVTNMIYATAFNENASCDSLDHQLHYKFPAQRNVLCNRRLQRKCDMVKVHGRPRFRRRSLHDKRSCLYGRRQPQLLRHGCYQRKRSVDAA